jgi:hypothetical protein
MDGSVFVSDPLVWYACLLTRADNWNGFAIQHGLCVTWNKHPDTGYSVFSADLLA